MKTTYTGPVKGRGLNKRGQANVSREELESFRAQYGKDKTLRDLLNAELPNAKPLKRVDAKPAAPAGRAEIPKGTGGAKAPPASTERKMSPLEMGVLTTAGALGAPLAARGAMKVAPKVAGMASKAGEAVKGAASKAGEAVKGAASKASEAVKDAMERRAAAKAAPERKDPSSLYPDPPKTGGVFRSAREPAPPKPRVKVEGTEGGVYRSETPKAESKKPSFRSRTTDRADERMDEYKKGGSVKGSGCETRGKKARYI